MAFVDKTHDPLLQSWVRSANGHEDFPIQNLPFGIFLHDGRIRGGVAIGDQIVDLERAVSLGCFEREVASVAIIAAQPSLNAFMALGEKAATSLRVALSDLLRQDNPAAAKLGEIVIPQASVAMQLPCEVGDFTDFLTSLPHTDRLGRLKGLAEPVPPAFKTLPVAYHGRSSTIRVSGTPVVRPTGQWRRPDGELVFEPVASLDYELELGALVGKPSLLAEPLFIDAARDHIFGYCLVNDWSAKGIQWWEQILGPFLGKSFMTSISPWVVTSQALAPFHKPARKRPEEDGAVFKYLHSPGDVAEGSLSVELTAAIRTPAMRNDNKPGFVVSRSTLECMYWTFAQMLTHHTSNGCCLRSGDLLASGTLSGETPQSMACLSERTVGGAQPLEFDNGETRGWLHDGDEIVMSARAEKPGFVSIGFGQCRGLVQPAPIIEPRKTT